VQQLVSVVAAAARRELDVFGDGELRHEPEPLRNVRELRPGARGRPDDGAFIGCGPAVEQHQERRLARPGPADDDGELVRAELQ